MIAFYHQTKTPISFWCRWGLNPKSLIQPSKTLSVELVRTHNGHGIIELTWNSLTGPPNTCNKDINFNWEKKFIQQLNFFFFKLAITLQISYVISLIIIIF